MPATGYLGPAGFTYTISDGQGGTASANVALSVVTAPRRSPIMTVALLLLPEHRLADPGFGIARQRHGPQWAAAVDHGGEQSSHGTASLNSSTQTISFVPTTGYFGAGRLHLRHQRGGRHRLANVALMVNDAGLFSATATPSITTVNDPNPVELGVKFQAATDRQHPGN